MMLLVIDGHTLILLFICKAHDMNAHGMPTDRGRTITVYQMMTHWQKKLLQFCYWNINDKDEE